MTDAPGDVLLISCYELGHQPLTLASPAAALRAVGISPILVDSALDPVTNGALRAASLIALSVPMHTALRLGARIAERARTVNPDAHICFYGLYATLNAEYLLGGLADSIIGGEYEQALVALAEAVTRGASVALVDGIPGVRTRATDASPVLARLPFVAPDRSSLPPPSRYAHLVQGERMVSAGYVEASRGCLHLCSHCPIPPVYGGRFFVVPRPVVLEDIRAQVRAGVGHVTFGDPDFFNGPRHAMEIARALHAEFPDVTFDATIKVEHILERREYFPELAELGCIFVVSAVESLSPGVLAALRKGHTAEQVAEAVAILDAAAIAMRPTFVAFTPWTTPRDYLDLFTFAERHDLIEHIDPIQFAIRLLVPPGSALLDAPDVATWLGPLDEAALTYRWDHADPRMDALQAEAAALVEEASVAHAPTRESFARLRALAEQRLGMRAEAEPVLAGGRGATSRRRQRAVPHLTESWFC